MNCPRCGTENTLANRFCLKCGYQFTPKDRPAQASYSSSAGSVVRRNPPNALSQAIFLGGGAALAGGGLSALGWFLPWFNLGSLGALLGGLIGLGLGSGTGLLNTVGVGNGLQLTMISMVGGLAILGERDGFFLGILGLILAFILISVILISVINIRLGIRLFELQASNGVGNRSVVWGKMQSLRKGSAYIFIIMVGIFVILSSIPFVTAVLSGGFYLTALGAAATYLGAMFSQSKLGA
jgi:hypothetical protein